jgi:diguanylate cyclase (GGDEF)-like protein
VLALLAAVYLFHAGALVVVRGGVVPPPYLELGPFNVLLLQTLLAFGMVLTAMEEAQRALFATNLQLVDAEHRLKTLAETDPLTGCFNRRVFRVLVDALRKDGAAHGVVVMLDMDGLKAINDAEGHGVGDAAIRAVADAIRSKTRNTDLAVRWGGVEFVVVMPGVSIAEGRTRQEQLRQAIAAGGFSASAGAAAYGEGVDIMAAVDQADRAMYASREARRASR